MSQYTGSVPDILRAADWRDRALCATPAGLAVDWFPNPADDQGITEAQAVCAACPVAAACLRDALAQEGGSHPEYRWGVRGGLTGDQRFNRHRTLVRARGEAEPDLRPRVAKCGTVSGYQKHLRLKTEPCPECREAKNEANRKQKRRRQPIQCGTRPGYRRHRDRGEEACEPCRIANTQADRRLRNTGTTLAPA
ncbi:WhiB family transcriptional regulator [Streptomyces coelicoflavus]|uniref:WhiB family transcriptional regulator n=1 Tax=Streptomyces coelicoflavus TaxID=285562 RepID=UPI003252205B